MTDDADDDLLPGGREDDLRTVVRSAGLVAFLALCASGPVAFLIWPPVRNKAVAPLPPASWASIRDGSMARAVETQAAARSRIAYHLRGIYAETAWELGVLDHDRVAIRADGWMFDRTNMGLSPDLVDRLRPARRRHFAAVARTAAELGVTVMFVIAPSKPTIYPDVAWPESEPPPGRIELMDQGIADARDAGLLAVDARPALRALREQGTEPFLRYDPHWTPEGAHATARLVAAALAERGFRPPPDQEVLAELVGAVGRPCRPGSVEILGMRLDVPRDEWSHYETVRSLQELLPRGEVRVRGKDGPPRLARPDHAHAAIALAGTSFTEWLGLALLFETRVEPNSEFVASGTGPVEMIWPLLEAIRSGRLTPEVVVWEITERHLAHHDWRQPVPAR